MSRRLESDIILFGTVVVLALFGALMVFSASAVMAAQRYGSSYYFLERQAAWLMAGLVVMFVVMNVDYRRLANPALVFPAVGVQFILLLGAFLQAASHHTHRWLHAGPLRFQPSEFSKIVLVLFLAYFLDLRRETVSNWRHTLLPLGLILALSVALIVKEPDFGTAFAVCLVAAAMLFAAGLDWRYFAIAGGFLIPASCLLIYFAAYRLKRVEAFLDPWKDPLGKGFQIIQSYIAVGSGGISGVGLMNSKQKLYYLPEPHTDFIFAVISEELGFIGAMLVVLLFGIILWRGLRAAGTCSTDFGRLLATGLTVLVVGQALVNMSVVVGLLPTKGIPLPFVSYGGSSLLMNLLAVGILLNVSQNAPLLKSSPG